MSAAAQVTWAKTLGKSGGDVQALGGTVKRLFGKATWQLAPDEAISSIEQDEWSFFVELEGEKFWITVDEDDDGNKKLSLSGNTELEEILASLTDKPDQ